MKICIKDNCVGCGICSLLSPEVFEINENYAVVNNYNIEEKLDICYAAMLFCPVNAINFVE